MITCDQSDYLEIACLCRIPVALSWTDGRRVEGTPLDTGYNTRRQECLLMQVGDKAEWIVLDDVQTMTAQVSNVHFEQIRFGETL